MLGDASAPYALTFSSGSPVSPLEGNACARRNSFCARITHQLMTRALLEQRSLEHCPARPVDVARWQLHLITYVDASDADA